jgi:hypothetical protein
MPSTAPAARDRLGQYRLDPVQYFTGFGTPGEIVPAGTLLTGAADEVSDFEIKPVAIGKIECHLVVIPVSTAPGGLTFHLAYGA